MTMNIADLVERLHGRDPQETITSFLHGIERELARVSIEDFAALCRSSAFGIDELVYEVAARKLGLHRQCVRDLEDEEKLNVEDESL